MNKKKKILITAGVVALVATEYEMHYNVMTKEVFDIKITFCGRPVATLDKKSALGSLILKGYNMVHGTNFH